MDDDKNKDYNNSKRKKKRKIKKFTQTTVQALPERKGATKIRMIRDNKYREDKFEKDVSKLSLTKKLDLLSEINRMYRDNKNARIYNGEKETIYEASGFLDETGKPYSPQKLRSMYGGKYHDKIKQLDEMLSEKFLDETNKRFKESFLKAGFYVMSESDYEKFSNMPLDEFMDMYYSGSLPEIRELYQETIDDLMDIMFGNDDDFMR